MAKIWITGAQGFIGRHLANWLTARGHIVSGIGHGLWPQSEASAWGVQHWLSGEIHFSNLRRLLHDGGAPDCIFHLAGGSSVSAAIAGPHEDFMRTVTTTAELLDWMRQEARTTRLVAISSAAVYGAGHIGPVREDQVHVPFSPYGYHKLMMENLCRCYADSYGLPVVVVRLFSVYGDWLKKQLLWDICSKLVSGALHLELGGTGEELRDWTEARDVVRALELTMGLALEANSMPVINVGTGQPTSVREVAAQVLGCWPTPVEVEFNGRSRPGDPFSLVADSSILRTMGFEWSIPVDRGIRDYVQWFLQYTRSDV
jgi:UDP-glucose 4-epimerase